MNVKKAAFTALLLSTVVACDRGGSAVETSEPIAPPAPATVAAPAKPKVDYPGSIDLFSKVGAGKGTPVALIADQKVSGRLVMERDGDVVAFGVRIGTYHGSADAGLRLSLCIQDRCERAEKSVADAADNDYLVFELPAPLPVAADGVLDYELARSADATRRVAIWTYPKLDTQTGIVDASGQEIPMVPRLSVHLQ